MQIMPLGIERRVMDLISSIALPSETPGFRLNEMVTDGNCPEWLMESGPTYMRRGGMGTDPQPTPDQQRMVEQVMRDSKAPERLSATEVAPILEALRGWEAADPNNAQIGLELSKVLLRLGKGAETVALLEAIPSEAREADAAAQPRAARGPLPAHAAQPGRRHPPHRDGHHPGGPHDDDPAYARPDAVGILSRSTARRTAVRTGGK